MWTQVYDNVTCRELIGYSPFWCEKDGDWIILNRLADWLWVGEWVSDRAAYSYDLFPSNEQKRPQPL